MTVRTGRFGVCTGQHQWPAEASERAEIAGELEDLGFGAIWFGNAAGDLDLPAQILTATSRITAATSIINAWTEPAELVARRRFEIVRDHPDRLLLGIGAGHKESVEPRTGRRYERPYQAVVDYLDRLDTAVPPVPPAERALAALGPRLLRLARERTAGAVPYLVTPAHTRQAREILGDGPLLAPGQMVLLESDPTAARGAARAALAIYLRQVNYTRTLLRIGFSADDLADGGSDRLVDGLVAWGDPVTVVDRLTEHHQAGADHVGIHLITAGGTPPLAQWRRLAAALSPPG